MFTFVKVIFLNLVVICNNFDKTLIIIFVFVLYRQLHIAIVEGFIEGIYAIIRLAPDPCLLDIPNDYRQVSFILINNDSNKSNSGKYVTV
jgi:hypothetical protein